jgi:hypothetical protein
MENFDTEVRLRLFDDFVRTERAPSVARLAELLETPAPEIRASLESLAVGKAIVLQPENREILMANPLCAVPTPFLVRAGGQSYFGSCVWDALGIIAMLGRDATLETSCQCCGEALTIDIHDSRPVHEPGIIHFAIPAKRWWENIVYT